MTATDAMTDEQFGAYALGILRRELGLAGFARFLRIYKASSSDYTHDRHKWLDEIRVDELATELQSGRNIKRTS